MQPRFVWQIPIGPEGEGSLPLSTCLPTRRCSFPPRRSTLPRRRGTACASSLPQIELVSGQCPFLVHVQKPQLSSRGLQSSSSSAVREIRGTSLRSPRPSPLNPRGANPKARAGTLQPRRESSPSNARPHGERCRRHLRRRLLPAGPDSSQSRRLRGSRTLPILRKGRRRRR